MSQSERTLQQWLLASIIGLVVTVPLAAVEPQSDKGKWDNLRQLGSGQEIQIVLNDDKSYRGTFESTSEDALVVRLATGEQTFDRKIVMRVSSKGPSHRLRNAALGAAIGAGGGAAIGAASGGNKNSYCCPRGGTAAVVGVIGLAIGGVTGAVLTTGGWHEVYRARSEKR